MRFSIRAASQRRYKIGTRGQIFSINMDFRQRLGSGGFADVFEGIHHGSQVVLKKMKTCTKNPTATLEAFEAEAQLLGLQHPHIIRLMAVNRQPDQIIIMEWIAEAQTLQVLIDNKALYKWRTYAQQLVSALVYLHQHDILHLDIKPANILVTPDQQCKLIDFGCSQKASNPSQSACHGTLAYRAPELFRGRLPTTKADVYSLAITLWSLKTQQTPYNGENNEMIVYQVVAQRRRPAPDPEFSMLWEADPNKRPEAQDLKV